MRAPTRIALAAALLLPAACADPGPPPVACAGADWWALRGQQDGAEGRSTDVWSTYAAQCPGLDPGARTAWRAGLERGRDAYCTVETAVEIGRRRAGTLAQVCAGRRPDRLAWANASGRAEFWLRREIAEHRRDAFALGGPIGPFPLRGDFSEASGAAAMARRAEGDLARLLAERRARFAAWAAEDADARAAEDVEARAAEDVGAALRPGT